MGVVKEEWFIKRAKHLDTEATWEASNFMKQQFPDLHLEDKVNLEMVGIVRPPIIHTWDKG